MTGFPVTLGPWGLESRPGLAVCSGHDWALWQGALRPVGRCRAAGPACRSTTWERMKRSFCNTCELMLRVWPRCAAVAPPEGLARFSAEGCALC